MVAGERDIDIASVKKNRKEDRQIVVWYIYRKDRGRRRTETTGVSALIEELAAQIFELRMSCGKVNGKVK